MKYLSLALIGIVKAQFSPCPSDIAQKFTQCYNSVPARPGYFPASTHLIDSPFTHLAICYGDYPLCNEIQKIALTDAGKCTVNTWRAAFITVSTSFTPCENPLPPRLVDRQFCTSSGLILSEYYGKLYSDVVRNNLNEQFTVNQTNGWIIAKSNGQCLEGELSSGSFNGVKTAPCDPNNAYQRWELSYNEIKSPAGFPIIIDTSNPGSVVVGGYPSSSKFTSQIIDCNQLRPQRVRIVSSRGKRVSEYYSGLYFDDPRDNANEIFLWDPNTKMFKSESSKECLDAYLDMDGKYKVHTYPCDEQNPNQKWDIQRGFPSQIAHQVHTGRCLDGDPTYSDHHLQMWECSVGNVNQEWNIVTLS
ncbi:hypothetical protein THRCLA_07641 [Thraustotheca clavata]|uniref:Ricin B lectin domain-containing protein n=1 Tax=Thraustotheca clavata TaxID=74557 RepID=A0A1V9ZCY1_9STRA|nr:hypothetical protein THRCLA_07641 [Thraustotheca clavata]